MRIGGWHPLKSLASFVSLVVSVAVVLPGAQAFAQT
jgi:hypothetical protein